MMLPNAIAIIVAAALALSKTEAKRVLRTTEFGREVEIEQTSRSLGDDPFPKIDFPYELGCEVWELDLKKQIQHKPPLPQVSKVLDEDTAEEEGETETGEPPETDESKRKKKNKKNPKRKPTRKPSSKKPSGGPGPLIKKLADNGFGNPLNKYAWSSAINDVDGTLCIGTWNVNMNWIRMPSYLQQLDGSPASELAYGDAFLRLFSGSPITYTEGGEVYCKKRNSRDFVKAFVADADLEDIAEHVGFRAMIYHKDEFWAGSSNGPNGPDVGVPYLQSIYDGDDEGAMIFRGDSHGANWYKDKNPDIPLNGFDKSIRAMCESSYSGKLFFGTESYPYAFADPEHYGSKIFSVDKRSNGQIVWENYTEDSHGLPKGIVAFSECTELVEGKMIFGTWASTTGYSLQVFDELKQKFYEVPDLPSVGGIGVMELRVVAGALYVGILDYGDGFKLIRNTDINNLDRARWEIITTDGFTTEQRDQIGKRVGSNDYPWSSAVYNGRYYLGTFSSSIPSADGRLEGYDSRAQLWYSDNGEDWYVINYDAFGEVATYGHRTMAVDEQEGKLYIGTASNAFIPVLSRQPYDFPNVDVAINELLVNYTLVTKDIQAMIKNM